MYNLNTKHLANNTERLKKVRYDEKGKPIHNGYNSPKTRKFTAKQTEAEKKVIKCLDNIRPLLNDLSYTPKQQKIILDTLKLILSDDRINIFKDMLLTNFDQGLIYLRQSLADIALTKDYAKKYVRPYHDIVSNVFQNSNFPGTLFKPVEFGTPDFTEKEFPGDTATTLYKVLAMDLGLTKPVNNSQQALKELNQLLNNLNVYDKLIDTFHLRNPGEQFTSSDNITNLNIEIDRMLPEQKKFFRMAIKHRNRLLIEMLYPKHCPINQKIIYKQTLQEFLNYRKRNGSEFGNIFNLRYEQIQKLSNTSRNSNLFEKFKKRINKHLIIIKSFLTGFYGDENTRTDSLIDRVQSYYSLDKRHLDTSNQKKLERIANITASNGHFEVRLKPHLQDEVFLKNISALENSGFLKANPVLEDFLWKQYDNKSVIVFYDDLSDTRLKSLDSITEKVKHYDALDMTDIINEILALKDNELFKKFYRPLGHGKAVKSIVAPVNNKDSLLLHVNALENPKSKFGDITDTIGMCITVENYQDIEKVMNCVEASFQGLILEKENLFAENSQKKGYRDVKYLIRINDYICFELQIKTIYEKVIGDALDHNVLYKNLYGLSDEEIDLLNPIVNSLLWGNHLKLAEEYQEHYQPSAQ